MLAEPRIAGQFIDEFGPARRARGGAVDEDERNAIEAGGEQHKEAVLGATL